MTYEEVLKAAEEKTWLVVKTEDPPPPPTWSSAYVIRADRLHIGYHGAYGPKNAYASFRYFSLATPNDMLKYGEWSKTNRYLQLLKN